MHTQRRSWKLFQQGNVASLVVSSCIVVILGLHPLGSGAGETAESALAHPETPVASCSGGTYLSAHGSMTTKSTPLESLRVGMHGVRMAETIAVQPTSSLCSQAQTAEYEEINGDAQRIVQLQRAMQALKKSKNSGKRNTQQKRPLSASIQKNRQSLPPVSNFVAGSSGNVFPFGQCTWWANQRYYQVHGNFVPWRANANAFQWVARANDFGWHVSPAPTLGSILVLQPGVEGAYGLGHVSFVEQVLDDGTVIASSMNWGVNPQAVTEAPFRPGPGVAFISA